MDKYEKFSDLLKKKLEEIVEKEIVGKELVNLSNKNSEDDQFCSISEQPNLIEEKLKEYMDNYNNSKLDNLKNSVFNTNTNRTNASGRLRTITGGANIEAYWGINNPAGPTGPYYPQNQNIIYPGTYTTTSLDFIDPLGSKIKKLEKQIDLLLKFMVMKGLIESEDEFSDFLDSVEVIEKLCEDEEEGK